MAHEELKQAAAQAALKYIQDDSVVGVGTGSTVEFFIEALATIKGRIEGAVASSEATLAKLRQHQIPIMELNSVSNLPVYVDGADECNRFLQLIKGGGGALTREKIIASAAKQFICIMDESKWVGYLGAHPVPVEVIPMARSFVARQIVHLGGDPSYREGVVTDNGNVILDIHNLKIMEPMRLEQELNNIPGVVCNGLFAMRTADVALVANKQGVEVRKASDQPNTDHTGKV